MTARGRVHSMTGFGRGTAQAAFGAVTVELRSTNHRYLEIEPRLPNGLSALEGPLAELLREHVRRGRVEMQVSVRADRGHRHRVSFDEELVQRYHGALLALKGRFGLKGPITLEHLLSLPQALTITEERVPIERLSEAVRQAARAAALDLVRTRRREGRKLLADIRRQLRDIERHARAVKRRLPKAMAQQRARLRQRLHELIGPGAAGSTSQIEQAAALVRDADVHEELVRLDSHLAFVRQTLGRGDLVGKRLDFIAQELMREANTTGAKVNDPEAAQHVVEIKGCIEKIREQVQNLE